MENYLRWTEITLLAVACMVGALAGSVEYLKIWFSDKYFYAICLFFLFFIIQIIIEIGAVRKLPVASRSIWILGSPALKIVLIRILVVSLMGWFILDRFVLDDLLSYLTLALLMALFVGDFLKSFRFLRGERK